MKRSLCHLAMMVGNVLCAICAAVGGSPLLLAAPQQALIDRGVVPEVGATDTSLSRARPEGLLVWDSGDSLKGSLISANTEYLTWKSPLFVDPLQIDLRALDSVRFEAGTRGSRQAELQSDAAVETVADSETVRISLRNGDALHGRLTAVTPQVFEIQSARHGTVKLHAAQVRSVQRVDSKGLLYRGPHGLDGWRHPAVTTWQAPPGWIEVMDGWLATSRPEAVMFREFEFPEKYEIEFVISSTRRPSFVFALGNKSDGSLRLESWDNALVAMSRLDFVSVDTLGDSQRRVHLFLFVDSAANRMTVYSESGKKLNEIRGRDTDPGKTGILIRNGEHDLTLEHLSVSRWDGTHFVGLREGQSRVLLSDGSVRYGELLGMSADGKSLRLKSAASTTNVDSAVSDTASIGNPPQADSNSSLVEVPLAQVRGLYLKGDSDEATAIVADTDMPEAARDEVAVESRPDADSPKDGELVQAIWSDGSVISGRLVRLDGQQMTVASEISSQTITGSLEGLERIRFQSKSLAAFQPDRLLFAGGSLQGTLSIDNQQPDFPVRWKPPGGRNASALTSGDQARFVRGEQSTDGVINVTEFPDVVFLANNDAMPCRVEGATETAVRVASPYFTTTQIPVAEIKAVELSRPPTRGRSGFADEGWRRIVGTPEHTPESVTFRASEAFGHASILKGDVVRFRLEWGRMVTASLTFHLFTELPSNLPTGPSVRFSCRGDQISVLDGSPVDPRVVRGDHPDRTMGTATVPQHSADVMIFRQGDKVRVSIDGRLVTTLDTPIGNQDARGLLMRASIINQRARVRVPEAAVPNDNIIRVSDFESRDVVGGSIRQFIDEEARQHTLTIPRFRRDQPPTHVLLAPNGDLLRGRLLNIDEKNVEFESQLDKLIFARERVAAVIWLQPIRESSAEPETPVSDQTVNALPGTSVPSDHEPGYLQAMLDSGLMVTMKPDFLDEGHLIGQSAQLGQCSIPVEAIREFCLGPWENEWHTASYSEWIPQHAQEPEWDLPEVHGGPLAASNTVGTVAPDFQLKLLDGSSFQLSDHKDKVVILDFWASWCGPCVKGLPACVEAASGFDTSQVIFVAVNLDETPQVIREFLAKQNIAPAVGLDQGGRVASLFQVSGIPHTVILGRDNIVESVEVGFTLRGKNKIASAVQQILDGTWKRIRVVEPLGP